MTKIRLFKARFASYSSLALQLHNAEVDSFVIVDSLDSSFLPQPDFRSGLSDFIERFRTKINHSIATSDQYLSASPNSRYEEPIFSLLFPKQVDVAPTMVELYRRWDGMKPGRFMLYTSFYHAASGTFARQSGGSILENFKDAAQQFMQRCLSNVAWYNRLDFNARLRPEIGRVCSQCGETFGRLERKAFICCEGHHNMLT